MKSYDYAHRAGVLPISWEEYASLADRLAEAIAGSGPDLIVGIARAGLFPATSVAAALRRELYPVRITRRVNDEVVHERPVWRVPVPREVAGQRVTVIDEIADTGETLRLVAEEVRRLGASHVVTATLAVHSWADPMPDVTALVSDALIMWPWDRRVYTDGRWVENPELTSALQAQNPD
ncbi:MAG TPA: phosphoribosyltransferase [Chloroflexota bacterium]|nr:phosphoribosyltransferase [Chloroflexota bacterium]